MNTVKPHYYQHNSYTGISNVQNTIDYQMSILRPPPLLIKTNTNTPKKQ
jgi:hypothetical protein